MKLTKITEEEFKNSKSIPIETPILIEYTYIMYGHRRMYDIMYSSLYGARIMVQNLQKDTIILGCHLVEHTPIKDKNKKDTLK